MKTHIKFMIIWLCLAAHPNAYGEPEVVRPFEIGPWLLGMTRGDVQAFTEFGPYSPARTTGGLETPNGLFRGEKTNISFVFDESRLKFIQVWKYEGSDVGAAQQAVLDLYRLFSSEFGGAEVENVDVSGPEGLDEGAMRVLLSRILGTARELAADIRQKHDRSVLIMFDMKPRAQPSGSRLHSQWGYSASHDTFYVFLFQDEPSAPPRKVPANIQAQ
jgi:hypothetical protein